jgi:hypothetical protein
MSQFLKDTPPVLWTVLIVGSLALADWLSTYFGGVAWVVPVVGAITMFCVPLIRILAQGEVPAGRGLDGAVAERSKLSRWLY